MGNRHTKDQIVNAADQLFYEQGFEHTSFSQIAEAVGISRGNFYYHFKSKDDILDAVIDLRLSRTSAMLRDWEIKGETPTNRILSFINILVMNEVKIKRFGCPVGTLCTELAKLDHQSKSNANKLFTLFRDWLRRQFEQLGRYDDADELSMHILALSQGVATLASAYQDEEFIRCEVNRLHKWLASIEAESKNDPKKEVF